MGGLNEAPSKVPLAIVKCPSDPENHGAAVYSNYLGVQGGGQGKHCCKAADRDRFFYDNGMLYANSRISPAHIRDGLSNVLMVGESTLQSFDMS